MKPISTWGRKELKIGITKVNYFKAAKERFERHKQQVVMEFLKINKQIS